MYRDHFIRHATTDWRVDHSNSGIADGIDFTLPSVYPREVDYVLGLCQEATSLEAAVGATSAGPHRSRLARTALAKVGRVNPWSPRTVLGGSVSCMRIAGARFLNGPNIHDDASGVVIGTEIVSLPPADQPIGMARDRCDAVFGTLNLAEMAEAWAAAAERGRRGLTDFLLRLASVLMTPKSIFPSGGRVLGSPELQMRVFLRCEHATTGLLAWECACKAVLACQPGEDRMAPFKAAYAAFLATAERLAAGPTTAAIARQAQRLGVPWQRLMIPGRFVQLGQGVHGRYLLDGAGDTTGAVSLLMAQDKMLTNRLLRAAGVPVLPMVEVASEASAIRAAESIGYPVVVKPCHSSGGRGVGLNLGTPAAVAEAFRLAAAGGDSVVVEKQAGGRDYRVLAVAGKVVAARAGSDPTNAIHPDNRSILERAAAVLELGIAEIDLRIDDIARPWREADGAVLGLNPVPDLGRHWPAGAGRRLVEPVIRALLPPGSDGRIPTCAITGSIGKTTTANMVVRILGKAGLVVGRCTTTGVRVGEERQRTGDCAGGRYARDLLLDRRIQAGVFELARGGLLKEGMGIDDVDVGAVLNVFDNHVGSDGVAGRAGLARIKAIVARRARRALLLNAEDSLCLAMRQASQAERICLVARDSGCAPLRQHVDAGGCAVTLRPSAVGAEILIVDHGVPRAVTTLAEIPATVGGRHGGKVWNAMFAAGIAHAMGASLDHIREGLRSFKPDMADSEGRLSIVQGHPFQVILHPIDGPEVARELAQFVRTTAVAGRKRVCLSVSGSRPDAYLRATGRVLAGAFDDYLCTNSPFSPRPDPQAVPGLLREGIVEGGVPDKNVICIPSDEDALHLALHESRPGDLLVVVSYATDKAVSLIEAFDSGSAS
ncbi:MAG: Mur ligase family protein [Dongiaceae bacterium]